MEDCEAGRHGISLVRPEGIEQWFVATVPDALGILFADQERLYLDPKQKDRGDLRQASRSMRSRIKDGEMTFLYHDRGLLDHLHDEIFFGDSAYSIGVQIADICTYLVTRHLVSCPGDFVRADPAGRVCVSPTERLC